MPSAEHRTLGPGVDYRNAYNSSKTVKPVASSAARIFISYKRGADPDQTVARLLFDELSASGCRVFIDTLMNVSVEWGKEIERQIAESDHAILLLGSSAVESDFVLTEIGSIRDAFAAFDRPRPIPVRIGPPLRLPYVIRGFVERFQAFNWNGPSDSGRLVVAVKNAILGRPSTEFHNVCCRNRSVPNRLRRLSRLGWNQIERIATTKKLIF